MKYKTVKNCGELGIEFRNIDSDGMRVSRDFLTRLIRGIVRRSINYFDETGDHVFTYREQQLHSVVCPAIAEITRSYLIEHPLRRKPYGEEEHHGHVDYWISYRNYAFLMELKHSHFAYKRVENPRQNITRKFNFAIKQLKSIRINECRDLTINKGLIKMALQAIVFYEGSKDKISKHDLEDRDFKELFKKLIENTALYHTSNLRSLWTLNERLVEAFPLINGSFEIYPAVAFVGKFWLENM